MKENPTETHIVVTHGTVITLFVCAHNPGTPFEFWQKLGLPSYVMLDYPLYRIIGIVEQLDDFEAQSKGF
ncbi:MAG: hypothetical protein GFH27_549279n182 [Chloroflexi bacterium AL-W]|nr:hypothetical protein [Chloroflexi bacterium AL-N1]NOK65148.1 hypothetical protein [Chloroflexi bacterium AL-N10]NOK79327.1 hypothetical protein [Chloroflexi bacterium AL-W]NOK87243.1 hypothetical protein [Chloroflexi bacterium AL-N15]